VDRNAPQNLLLVQLLHTNRPKAISGACVSVVKEQIKIQESEVACGSGEVDDMAEMGARWVYSGSMNMVDNNY
jgi:hypothetical protein